MYGIQLDRNADTPLSRQLYHQLRQKILAGSLPAGSRLPPTRTLAAHFGIARNIAVEVYEQLQLEGFLASRPGSYTCVARGALLHSPAEAARPQSPPAAAPENVIDFRPGLPDLSQFPRKHWRDELSRILLDTPAASFGYGDPVGCRELREVLPAHLFLSRGVACRPDQIIITAGSTQALTLATRLLTATNSAVVVENPLNAQLQRYLASLGCRLHPLEVDRQGLRTELLAAVRKSPPAFTLVTPSHQFPTGGILPVQRRIQLIRFARDTGSFIVEDDYENEFIHGGNSISSLQGLAPDSVLYIGTFSKTLAPALRLGYLVLPPALLSRFHATDWFAPQQPSGLDQLVLRNFIVSGRLRQHTERMNKLYRRKRGWILQELARCFGRSVRLPESGAGLHVTVEFLGVRFSPALADQWAARHFVRVHPVAAHVAGTPSPVWQSQIILGYGNLSEPQISVGINRLAAALAADERTAD